jgi:hypothetical protein
VFYDERLGMWSVTGYDDAKQVAHVVDNDRAEVQDVPLEALARARSSTAFPQPTRHCTYRITWPRSLPDLKEVAASAFSQSATNMRAPSRDGIADPTTATVGAEGLKAVALFTDDVTTWAELPDYELGLLLFILGAFIEKAGTGGGLFRLLLADVCAELARLTSARVWAPYFDARTEYHEAFDTAPRDGRITVGELEESNLMHALFAPDLDRGRLGISFGLGFSAR